MSQSPKQTVSLLMIVRNEEQNLEECLKPVAALFDEIVIVDTGSVDSTKQIAARFTDRVFDFAWCDDFAAARNEALSHSRGDWIFWLDADDRISPNNVARLQSLLQRLKDRSQAYYMTTVVHGRYECEGPQWISHPRLVRRHPDLHWRGRVHERFRPELTELGHELIWSDIQIDHVGYQDPILQRRKLQRGIRLLRMDYAVDPDDCNTILQLGMAYAELGNRSEAKKLLQRLIVEDEGRTNVMSLVYRLLADLSAAEGNLEDSLRLLAGGLSRFPADEGLLYSQANVQIELGRLDAARHSLEQIIDGKHNSQHYIVPGEIKSKLAPLKLAHVFRSQHRFDQAERILKSLVGIYPADSHAWYALGSVYLDSNQSARLDDVVDRLDGCPQGKYFAAVLLIWRYLQRRELAPAGALIDSLIAEIPEVPLPRLLRCQWLTLQGAPLTHRLQACRDLLRVQPNNKEGLAALPMLENEQRLISTAATTDWSTSVMIGADLTTEVGAA